MRRNDQRQCLAHWQKKAFSEGRKQSSGYVELQAIFWKKNWSTIFLHQPGFEGLQNKAAKCLYIWNFHKNREVCVTVCALKSLRYKFLLHHRQAVKNHLFDSRDKKRLIQKQRELARSNEVVLCLSVQWSDRRHSMHTSICHTMYKHYKTYVNRSMTNTVF